MVNPAGINKLSSFPVIIETMGRNKLLNIPRGCLDKAGWDQAGWDQEGWEGAGGRVWGGGWERGWEGAWGRVLEAGWEGAVAWVKAVGMVPEEDRYRSRHWDNCSSMAADLPIQIQDKSASRQPYTPHLHAQPDDNALQCTRYTALLQDST